MIPTIDQAIEEWKKVETSSVKYTAAREAIKRYEAYLKQNNTLKN